MEITEVTEDLLAIQGILISLDKTPKELNKIKFRGGNEKTINALMKLFSSFLSSKNYIKGGKINNCFDNEIRQIVLFLILNTELNHDLNISGFDHLIHITPQLSKYLLANIIIEFDLSRFYCGILKDYFSIDLCGELIVEIIPFLEKCKAKTYLNAVKEFLQLIVEKIDSSSDEKNISENVEKITKQGTEMLTYIIGLNTNQASNWNKTQIYIHMGYCILRLLELLLLCNCNNFLLNTIIEKLMGTCCSIMKAVTLDVYCTWTEVSEMEENLQSLISTKTYLVIEKYQKYAYAKELINMLGSIARKPKTLSELIRQADIPTIIKMINKADNNQSEWFSALLSTNQILENPDTLKCISQWLHLSTEQDVRFLLNLSVHTSSAEAKKVVMKCASNLGFDDLVLAVTRYFHHNGMGNVLNSDVQAQLTLIFNKILNKSSTNVDFSLELTLLLLQNPSVVLSFIFGECLRNGVFTECLIDFFPHMKHLTSAQHFNLTILNEEILKNVPDEQNFNNYIKLFEIFQQTNFFSSNVVCNLFLNLLKKSYEERNFEQIKYFLEILNIFQYFEFVTSPETEGLFNLLFELMKNCRCDFLEFNKLQMDIVKEIVNFLKTDCDLNSENINLSEDRFVLFYQRKILRAGSSNFLKFLCEDINMENYSEVISNLLKILPKCTIQEWSEIVKNLQELSGNEKLIEMLNDVLVLLCHFVINQEKNVENVNVLMSALEFSLQNYGTILKDLQSNLNLKEDNFLTKNVCRLLRYLPKQIQKENGLLLAQILSDYSLKSLIDDKSFAASVMAIEDENIRKMLAKKVLS